MYVHTSARLVQPPAGKRSVKEPFLWW